MSVLIRVAYSSAKDTVHAPTTGLRRPPVQKGRSGRPGRWLAGTAQTASSFTEGSPLRRRSRSVTGDAPRRVAHPPCCGSMNSAVAKGGAALPGPRRCPGPFKPPRHAACASGGSMRVHGTPLTGQLRAARTVGEPRILPGKPQSHHGSGGHAVRPRGLPKACSRCQRRWRRRKKPRESATRGYAQFGCSRTGRIWTPPPGALGAVTRQPARAACERAGGVPCAIHRGGRLGRHSSHRRRLGARHAAQREARVWRHRKRPGPWRTRRGASETRERPIPCQHVAQRSQSHQRHPGAGAPGGVRFNTRRNILCRHQGPVPMPWGAQAGM